MTKIAIVVPVFNESSRFPETYWLKLVTSSTKSIHWLFVNDGSTDDTLATLKRYEIYSNVDILNIQTNSGKAEAVRQGFLSLFQDFEILGMLDSDGSFDANEVLEIGSKVNFLFFEANLDQYHTVWCSRKDIQNLLSSENPFRRYLSFIVSFIIGHFWENKPWDTQCGLKFYRKCNSLYESIQLPFSTKWFFEIELFFRQKNKLGSGLDQIMEYPLKYCADIPGSKITFSKFPQLFLELCRIVFIIVRD